MCVLVVCVVLCWWCVLLICVCACVGGGVPWAEDYEEEGQGQLSVVRIGGRRPAKLLAAALGGN